MSSPTRGRLVRAIQGVLFVSAVAGLFWLLGKIGWPAILAAFHRIGVVGAIVILTLGFIENLLDAYALRASLRHRARLFSVGLANGTGALINALLPWEIGEVAKAALLHRVAAPRDAVSATMISNYAFKISRPLLTTFASLVAIALRPSELPVSIMFWVLTGNLLGFLPFGVIRLLVARGMAETLVRLLGRVPFLRGRQERWLSAARNLDIDVRSFDRTNPARYWSVVGAQVAARFAAWMSVLASVRFMGLGYSFGLVAVIFAAFNVAEFLITIFPVRLGVAEGASFAVFTLFGLDPATGVILYVVLRLKALGSNAAWLPFALVPLRDRGSEPTVDINRPGVDS